MARPRPEQYRTGAEWRWAKKQWKRHHGRSLIVTLFAGDIVAQSGSARPRTAVPSKLTAGEVAQLPRRLLELSFVSPAPQGLEGRRCSDWSDRVVPVVVATDSGPCSPHS